jgi:HlyD family secretion protein
MQRKRMVTKFYKLITGICLVMLLLVSCSSKDNNQFQGYIEGKYTYMSAAVAGKLEQLLVKRGDQVRAGQVLFVLDKEPEASQLQQAEQKLAQAKQTLLDLQKGERETIIAAIQAQQLQAKANLAFSEQTYLRYSKLFKEKVIDKATLDQTTSNYQRDMERVKEVEANLAEAKQGKRENLIAAQEAAVAAIAAEVRQATWAFEQKTQCAPTTAEVFDTLHEMGEYIAPGQATVVLLPQDTYKAVFFIPETTLSQLKMGNTVSIACDSCKKRYVANINFISPEAEFTPPVIFSKDSREKLVYRIEAKLDAEAAAVLRPGQPVDIYLGNQQVAKP